MMEGSIVLTPVPQADGNVKNRPALVLREMPRYGDCLVCGISSQLRHEVVGFDERLASTDPDFADSGVRTESLIRLGFLSVLPRTKMIGSIGAVSPERRRRLLPTLSEYLLR